MVNAVDCLCRDYEVLPELDRYEESELAPNTDYGVMSYEARRRAEEVMNERDDIEDIYGRQGEILCMYVCMYVRMYVIINICNFVCAILMLCVLYSQRRPQMKV